MGKLNIFLYLYKLYVIYQIINDIIFYFKFLHDIRLDSSDFDFILNSLFLSNEWTILCYVIHLTTLKYFIF
jgi:hypothetical protein